MSRNLTLAALVAALIAPTAGAQDPTGREVPTQFQGAEGSATRAVQDTTRAAQDTTREVQGAQATQGTLREAPQGTGRGGQAMPTVSYDELFAMAAADGGMAEVALSELGVQKATDPQLKQFSQRMVQEHTQVNRRLMALASQKQIPLPRNPDARAQFCARSLSGLSGEKFDACYAKAQCVAHMDAVAAFESEAERGQDPDLKALAAETLPHIKEHLAAIKPIAERFERDYPSTEGAARK